MSSSLSQGFSTDPVRQFRDLALRYTAHVGGEGIRTAPFHSEALPLFSALNQAEQGAAIAELAGMVAIFDEIKAEGQRLKDTPQLLWRSLRRLGYLWESDIFDKIRDGDVVQLLTVGGKFVFWNLRLLEMVSFTVEQLFCTPWWQMGYREPDVSPQLGEAVMKVFTGQITSTFDPKIEEHRVYESGTTELLSFRIRMKYLSPVRREGQIAGLLCVNGAELVGSELHCSR